MESYLIVNMHFDDGTDSPELYKISSDQMEAAKQAVSDGQKDWANADPASSWGLRTLDEFIDEALQKADITFTKVSKTFDVDIMSFDIG